MKEQKDNNISRIHKFFVAFRTNQEILNIGKINDEVLLFPATVLIIAIMCSRFVFYLIMFGVFTIYFSFCQILITFI